jgi:hypothetical protein
VRHFLEVLDTLPHRRFNADFRGDADSMAKASTLQSSEAMSSGLPSHADMVIVDERE